MKYLPFERKIADLDNQINELREINSVKGINYSAEISALQQKLLAEFKSIFSNLTAWQIVQIARHPERPVFTDYLKLMVEDFQELHGDRRFGDDKAIITGLGKIKKEKILIVGQNKGRKIEEKIACNFGMPYPEGYRKALLKMKLAEKFNLPIVTFIDTPGAYPGIEAEQRGQAQAIANNLFKMPRLKTPIICIVIGEGGSGGALGIGVGDRLAMLEFSYYSVISPEGCSTILWRDTSKTEEAAKALKLTSQELLKLKIIDAVIPEPLGGAHRNFQETIYNVEEYIAETLIELKNTPINLLLENRYKKLRSIGAIAGKFQKK